MVMRNAANPIYASGTPLVALGYRVIELLSYVGSRLVNKLFQVTNGDA
jgi:hypothetical protein